MVYQGEPGGGAVRASTSVILLDEDEIRDPDGTSSGVTLAEDWRTANEFDIDPVGAVGDDDAYNVVQIEVVAWGT
jgi:hypothetical protein